MTIPLETYDPDWAKRFDEINAELKTLRKLPRGQVTQDEIAKLTAAQLEAFHAQFQTTGDYAAWMENNIKEVLDIEGVDFVIPEFPRDASVERTRSLYSLLHDRIKLVRKAQFCRRPVIQPTAKEAFTTNLGLSESREVKVLNVDLGIPRVEDGIIFGSESEKTQYLYVLEHKEEQTNICFMHAPANLASALNIAEELLQAAYDKEMGLSALLRKGQYRSPDRVQLYVLFPHFSTNGGEEHFFKADLIWDNKNSRFKFKGWTPLEETPYALRKIAYEQGLALNPDSPKRGKKAKAAPRDQGPGGVG
jgi:hypothetical protein